MTACQYFDNCRYFKERMSTMPSTMKLVQHNYCEKLYDECARFKVTRALGESAVPDDLSPSDMERADAFIRQQGKS